MKRNVDLLSAGLMIVINALLLTGCARDKKLFTALPENETGILFANTITETEELNINQYLYAHNGGGVAAGDINNDGLPDLYFTANQLPNKLYLNKGNLQFEDITEKAGVAGASGTSTWTTGVVMADINHDGWLDLYVSQVSNFKFFTGHSRLYINNGDLTFTERSNEYNLDLKCYAQHAAFFDYDLDGDLDLYQLNHGVHNPDVYIRTEQRIKRDSLAGDRLFRNDGGKFHDVSEEAGISGWSTGYGLAVGIGDLDDNGCPDIYVSNDFHENDYVYYNNCDGTFREDVKGTLGHVSTFSMGNDIADINNDGLPDIITLDMKPEDEVIRKQSAGADPYDIYNYKLSFGYFYQYPRNMLQLNRGNLFASSVQFSEVGQFAGVDATDWSWSALLADLDNDGWKDIFITNGIVRRPIDLDYINFTYNDEVARNTSTLEMAYKMPEGAVHNYAYRNSGKLLFEDVSDAWGFSQPGYSMGTAYADLDNDGDLDLVVNNLNATASVFRNNAENITDHHFLRVRLNGSGKNTFGIGAKVTVALDDKTITQTLNPSRGWLSSVDYTLNFGIGTAETIRSVRVTWSDGREQVLQNVTVDQTIVLKQQNAGAAKKELVQAPRKLFENITKHSGVSFVHTENAYVDFSVERLMPHKLSTEGPPLATGDVDRDGLDDFFIGGASGQTGALYLQKKNDSAFFQQHPVPAFDADKEKEDTDAVFFDADQDGDLDLYVVSGGGEEVRGSSKQDRLYLNDGHGDFTKAAEALPAEDANGSCVVAADLNNDDRIDLFVGTHSLVGKYGLSPDSYLLWNTGNGKFAIDTTANAHVLRELGMVTDAVWLPATKELAVVGEWMPLTFLTFSGDRIAKREMPNTTGWWNTIHADDIDGDGDTDLLAGNLGLNTDLRASQQEPVGLYVSDFDHNFMTDPMLTYYRQHREWLYPGLDDIKKQMPRIRSKYPGYGVFASHSFAEVFPADQVKPAVHKKAEIFQSVYLVNDSPSHYTLRYFPDEVQFSPVYGFATADVNGDGFRDILAVGNFYGNTPSLGKSDSSYGNCLLGNGEGEFRVTEPRATGFAVYGEARDIRIIRTSGSTWVIVSRNNAEPRVFSVR